jgi:GT2 family glycosyltransferase
MPSTSVIIVNWNGARHLPDCLGSLQRQSYRDFETILVDNGSTDDSIILAQKLLPDIRIVRLANNTGYAAANNRGIQTASGRYVVLLNNDTETHPEFLQELVTAVERDAQIGMVGPKILNFFDRDVIDSVGGLLVTPDGIGQGRGRGERDRGQYDHLTEVLLPSGCAALYRKEMLDAIGLLAEDFFAYCEDLDLGLRGVWAGWKALAAPRAIVFHKYSATSSAYSPFKLFLVERNHYFVLLKNYPWRLLTRVPFWTAWRFGLMLAAALRGKGKGCAVHTASIGQLIGALLRGHWEALRAAPFQLRRGPVSRALSSRRFARLLRKHRMSLKRMLLSS